MECRDSASGFPTGSCKEEERGTRVKTVGKSDAQIVNRNE